MSGYMASPDRYSQTPYRRSGRSGLLLPAISLGLWHNFGDDRPIDHQRAILRRAFDLGITHFDLANNYGPPYGSAEINFGRILREDFASLRDELVISTKAGWDMWPGPYGDFGSRKYLLASLDQSLKRMGLDYVDIFYHHRFDPDDAARGDHGRPGHRGAPGQGPLRRHLVLLGRAHQARPSGYCASSARRCLIHQPSYSMLNRWIEGGLLDVSAEEGVGCIAFSPLAQGMLTDRYLKGVPEGSRASKGTSLPARDVEPGQPRPRASAGRHRGEARPTTLPDGALVGAARPARDVSAHRRQQRHATG